MVLLLLSFWGCGPSPAPKSNSEPKKSPFAVEFKSKDVPAVADQHQEDENSSTCSIFIDQAQALGIDHTYQNGGRGYLLMVESTGGGGAWLDYDADGWWDLYLNQGGDPSATASGKQPTDQLFRSVGGKRFENVSQFAGVFDDRYGQGVAAGDYDADGFDDLYVCNLGSNSLYRNQGDGTFEEVALPARVACSGWSSTAAWADLDRDGLLDLYVCRYCKYDPKNPVICQRNQRPRICHPKDLEPEPDEFFRNRGDGTFSAEASERGLYGANNRGLGVVMADLDNDSDLDVFVANDTTANFYFQNNGFGYFTEMAAAVGCAVDRNGSTRANMGIACGDYDNNGWLDLCVTNFHREGLMLFKNLGTGFEDVSGLVGLHLPSYSMLGFGAVMADYDLDARQELFVANGHIEPYQTEKGILYEMEAQLFEFQGSQWTECSQQAGDYFKQKRLGRGTASCDFDQDGDVDLCVMNQNAPTALLQNESPRGHWLQLRFVGTRGDRRGVGTRVTLRADNTVLMQELCGGTSYAVSHQPQLTFGLGDWTGPVTLELRWPSGRTQTLRNVAIDQLLTIREP